MEKDRYEFIANQVFNASLEVHRSLGAGLLESVYVHCFVEELRLRGLEVQVAVKVPLFYKGKNIGKEFFIDILIENEIVVEAKSCDGLLPIHEAQLLTYLKLADKKLGFLINFNVTLLKYGFRRKVNNY